MNFAAPWLALIGIVFVGLAILNMLDLQTQINDLRTGSSSCVCSTAAPSTTAPLFPDEVSALAANAGANSKTYVFEHGELEFDATEDGINRFTTLVPALDVTGSLFVTGDVIVRGCMIWEQSPGLFRNSCKLYADWASVPCKHGTPNLLYGTCTCDPHWSGIYCDIHDCHERGQWTGLDCVCQPPWTAATLCSARECDFHGLMTLQDNDPCVNVTWDCTALPNCRGECVHNQCLCTTPGSMGYNCDQLCGDPVIDDTRCPGRGNWGLSYISQTAGFAVCGGGYVFETPLILQIKGIQCLIGDADCLQNFIDYAHICCAPGIQCEDLSTIPGHWRSWKYVDTQTTQRSLFNAITREQFLSYYASCGSTTLNISMDCLRPAYLAVQEQLWAPLTVGELYKAGMYKCMRTSATTAFLGVTGSGPFRLAQWGVAMNIWIEESGVVDPFSTGQLYYLVQYNLMRGTLCLADTPMSPFRSIVMQQSVVTLDLAYWVDLRDQPGMYLDRQDYCGLFSLADNTVRRRTAPYYLGVVSSLPGWTNLPSNITFFE